MIARYDSYDVVINAEEQYSIWPVGIKIPDGWNKVGVCDSEEACLDYIEKNWKDMRPLSLRKKLHELTGNTEEFLEMELKEPCLIQKLTEKEMTIEVMVDNLDNLISCLENEYLYIRFTETCGKTEIGIKVSPLLVDEIKKNNLSYLHISSDFCLDFSKLDIELDVNLSDFTGRCVVSEKK